MKSASNSMLPIRLVLSNCKQILTIPCLTSTRHLNNSSVWPLRSTSIGSVKQICSAKICLVSKPKISLLCLFMKYSQTGGATKSFNSSTKKKQKNKKLINHQTELAPFVPESKAKLRKHAHQLSHRGEIRKKSLASGRLLFFFFFKPFEDTEIKCLTVLISPLKSLSLHSGDYCTRGKPTDSFSREGNVS